MHQHVPNTDAAKAARRKDVGERTNGTNEEVNKDTDIGKDSTKGQSESANANSKRERPNEEEPDDVDERSTTDDELASSAEERDEYSRPRKKAKTDEGKQRQVGKRSVQKAESNDSGNASEEHGEPGNIDRLPEEGQSVCWRAASGWCEGVTFMANGSTMLTSCSRQALSLKSSTRKRKLRAGGQRRRRTTLALS